MKVEVRRQKNIWNSANLIGIESEVDYIVNLNGRNIRANNVDIRFVIDEKNLETIDVDCEIDYKNGSNEFIDGRVLSKEGGFYLLNISKEFETTTIARLKDIETKKI